MHVVIEDLDLEHVWILQPGAWAYPLTGAITALFLKYIHDVNFHAAP